MFAIPYTAWGAELAQDYHERTTVVQIRSLFGVVGGVIGATAPIAIAKQFVDQRWGFAVMAAVLGRDHRARRVCCRRSACASAARRASWRRA